MTTHCKKHTEDGKLFLISKEEGEKSLGSTEIRKRSKQITAEGFFLWWNDTDSVNDWGRALSKLIANRSILLVSSFPNCFGKRNSIIRCALYIEKVGDSPTIIEGYFTFVPVELFSLFYYSLDAKPPNFWIGDASAWWYLANLSIYIHTVGLYLCIEVQDIWNPSSSPAGSELGAEVHRKE